MRYALPIKVVVYGMGETHGIIVVSTVYPF